MVTQQIHQLIPVDGRTVRLISDFSVCTVAKENKAIQSLTFDYLDGPCVISVGNTITVGEKSRFKINIIVEYKNTDGSISHYDLLVAATNTSSIMVLPLLGGNRALFMWDQMFVNAFVATEDNTNCIALLYKYSAQPLFVKFEAALCSFRTFVKRIDPDPYHVLFIFDIPKDAKSSYEYIKNGQYSLIDDKWKFKILQFHGFDAHGHTGQILFQAPTLRKTLEEQLQVVLTEDAELYDKLDITKETYNPEYYTPKNKILR
tara:strand:+ start:1252 stop:2031 length:780 start_codon:yes stop_codon:yes gene_type:complete